MKNDDMVYEVLVSMKHIINKCGHLLARIEKNEPLSEQGINDYCVTFPYIPAREKLEIVTEDCMYDKTQKGDFDTFGILYANVPQRGKIVINKFYKETENGFEPISKEEYDMRTSAANNDL